ncbi:chaperone protein dnaJ C76, chloroplastic-like isoform X2 [Cucumis melo]|uniref:Chaperone protein dnaJ C76, chloroplastic-like isoform X2 n=1 Tax=Cucumis melo TaxID=3656 RepID=A0A1S3C990_CUCME|nr:chaperone protein dnaJ C76, chloroplastic-like isoform X2 [Cucumis melo]
MAISIVPCVHNSMPPIASSPSLPHPKGHSKHILRRQRWTAIRCSTSERANEMNYYAMPLMTSTPSLAHHNDHNKYISRKQTAIRCSAGERANEMNYYELLGVSADSNAQEIKAAYRMLQKKFHPDIAGQEGHEYTLRLNEAYRVLMREDRRKQYDTYSGGMRVRFGNFGTGLGYSSWNGPLRPQALFVDGNACIGCRECVHNASNTFTMDDTLGRARVKVQYGDNDQKIQVSVESCPVNCIYWVEKEELEVLEYLMQPLPKKGYGVFGGGWEIPANVFMAAKAFTKQLKRQEQDKKYGAETVEETPAQAEARANATMKIQREKFYGVWNWVKQVFSDRLGIPTTSFS